MSSLAFEYHFEKDSSYLEIVVEYMFSKLNEQDKEAFVEEAKQLSGPLGGSAMTLAEALRQDGLLEVAGRLIEKGFSDSEVAELTGLTPKQILKVKNNISS